MSAGNLWSVQLCDVNDEYKPETAQYVKHDEFMCLRTM